MGCCSEQRPRGCAGYTYMCVQYAGHVPPPPLPLTPRRGEPNQPPLYRHQVHHHHHLPKAVASIYRLEDERALDLSCCPSFVHYTSVRRTQHSPTAFVPVAPSPSPTPAPTPCLCILAWASPRPVPLPPAGVDLANWLLAAWGTQISMACRCTEHPGLPGSGT